MQVYRSSLKEDGRPQPARNCPKCEGCQKFQKHGCYRRYSGVEGEREVVVERYLCPGCGHTWSVIPEGMMPYRSLPVERFEQLADGKFGLADGGARPPPATEKEEGCFRRTCKALTKRIPFLCGLLGQQMPVLESQDICGFWRALRKLGPTAGILARLARDFKTSLLRCYRSLRAFWEREKAPVPA